MPSIDDVSRTAATSPTPGNAILESPSVVPKPCCVCRKEKSTRDECFLFSEKGGEIECEDQIAAYKKCMAGFGFNI